MLPSYKNQVIDLQSDLESNGSGVAPVVFLSVFPAMTIFYRHWRRSRVFLVNFELISHFFLLVFLLLTLNK